MVNLLVYCADQHTLLKSILLSPQLPLPGFQMKKKRVFVGDCEIGCQQLDVRSSVDEAWDNATLDKHTLGKRVFFSRQLPGFQMKRKGVCEDDREVGCQQLEVKSLRDEAWYNATLEVFDDRVHVRFEEFDEGHDEIWYMNDLKKNRGKVSDVIRLSSPQLQDGDCNHVVEGIVVCAAHVRDLNCSDEDGVEEVKYFDAVITKVDRVPHTFPVGEEQCHCVFEAYWISGPDKRKHRKHHTTVLFDCGDICLLHPGSVETHPVVKRILRLLNSRIPGRSEQPVKEMSNYEKSRTEISGFGRTGDQSKCSPVSSEQTTGSFESNDKGWMPQPKQEDSRSVETAASKDISSSTSSTVASKQSKLHGREQKNRQVIPLKTGKKMVNIPYPSGTGSSKLHPKRMRGSVTNLRKKIMENVAIQEETMKDVGEIILLKKQVQEEKFKEELDEACSQDLPNDDYPSLKGKKILEEKEKRKLPIYKLSSDIETSIDLKGVLEHGILNAKVELTLREILGIAKSEFHDNIIDIIKKKQIEDDVVTTHAIDTRISKGKIFQ